MGSLLVAETLSLAYAAATTAPVFLLLLLLPDCIFP
jgi:hypothetical protein